jgi:hypothetical protein
MECIMKKLNERKNAKEAAAEALEVRAVVLSEGDCDETENGASVWLNRGSDWDGVPFRVRMTVEAEARPLALIRVNGKWYLQFDVQGNQSPMFGVELGEGGALSFERAAELLADAKAEEEAGVGA